MTSEQKLRLTRAMNLRVPLNLYTLMAMTRWKQSRDAVRNALSKTRSKSALQAGLRGAVYIEACVEMDRHILIIGG